jgi:hypothetical protein
MSRKLILALAAGMAVLLVRSALADETSITTRQGRGADAPVQSGTSKDKNFGATPQLMVKKGIAPDYNRKTYLRFDVGTQTAASKSASLTLCVGQAYAVSPSDKVWTFNVYGLHDGAVPQAAILGEDWDEKAITWENAPANDTTSPNGTTADATLLGTFTIIGKGNPGDSVSLSSPELTKFVQSDTNGLVTFILTRAEADTKVGLDDVVHVFASKEQRTYAPPSLVLTK